MMEEWIEEEWKIFCQHVKFAVISAWMTFNRDQLREMESEERRKFCNNMKAKASGIHGNRAGKFFNEMAGSPGPQKADNKELGWKIMDPVKIPGCPGRSR